jgi:hypothetical protein
LNEKYGWSDLLLSFAEETYSNKRFNTEAWSLEPGAWSLQVRYTLWGE